jgi:hypothetical protein
LDAPAQSRALQALEVRAFGCLLEELAARAEPDVPNGHALTGLVAMAQDCLNPDPAKRPDVTGVEGALRGLSGWVATSISPGKP